MVFIFWMLSFKPAFSLSSFTFIKRLFSSSSLSAIRVVSSAYMRLLIFLLAILIPACASSSPAFHMMYSAYKLNNQGDNIQPWCTPFTILNQSELKWTGMGKFNSDDHYIYYCGQESLRRNGVALIVNKRVWNVVLEWSLKKWQNDLVSFPMQTIQYKSMYQPLMPKKLKLNGSMKTYRRRQWHPTPVLLPGKSHGQRSLVGCSP